MCRTWPPDCCRELVIKQDLVEGEYSIFTGTFIVGARPGVERAKVHALAQPWIVQSGGVCVLVHEIDDGVGEIGDELGQLERVFIAVIHILKRAR